MAFGGSPDMGQLLFQGGVRRHLQLPIDGQDQIVAGNGALGPQHPKGPAEGIDFHLLAAILAPEMVFVVPLQTGPADEVRAPISLILQLRSSSGDSMAK